MNSFISEITLNGTAYRIHGIYSETEGDTAIRSVNEFYGENMPQSWVNSNYDDILEALEAQA